MATLLKSLLFALALLVQAMSVSSQVCRDPDPPHHATAHHCDSDYWFTTAFYRQGSKCTLLCDDGYALNHGDVSQTVTCGTNGYWSKASDCARSTTVVTAPVASTCSQPPAVNYGIYVCASTTYNPGTSCQLYCSRQHQVNGNAHIFCGAHGHWGTPGSCIESQCSEPPAIQMGHYICPAKSYPHGTSCSLLCDGGYRPVSNNVTITCRQDETWSPTTSCMEGCLAGTYAHRSPSGEVSCEVCPKGTYQPDVDKPSCIPCPAGWTTVATEATDVNSCRSMCHAGTASSSGVEPCHLCPLGTYQNATGGLACLDCPVGLTTTTVGSMHCVSV